MESIADDYEKVYREYCELKERCDKLQDKLTQYEKMESTMNSTLMLAQQTAEKRQSYGPQGSRTHPAGSVE